MKCRILFVSRLLSVVSQYDGNKTTITHNPRLQHLNDSHTYSMHIVLRFFVFVVALLIIFWYSICRRLAHFRERVTIENRAQLRDSVQQAIYLFEYNDFHFILFF